MYRKNHLIHWSPALRSVVSDIEVNHQEILPGKKWLETPNGKAQVGQIYDIKYKVIGSQKDEAVTVSTTRPETILGDVAIAVHPNDERYSDMLNRKVMLGSLFLTVLFHFSHQDVPAEPTDSWGLARIGLIKRLKIF